jgi:hypothetical protein
MNQLIAFVLSFLVFFDFFGCAALRVKFAQCAGLAVTQAVMVDPQYDENGELLTCRYELHWDGREYEEYGFADNESIGKLFGLTDMPGSSRVFLAVGQRAEDWIVWGRGDLMGWFVLCKEKHVTVIPDGFVPFFMEGIT